MPTDKLRVRISGWFNADTKLRWGLLLFVALAFTVIFYPNLVIKKSAYAIGDVAQRDIKAPRDFFIEDQAATALKRQQVMDEVLTVYDFDAGQAERLKRNVNQAFADLRPMIAAVAQPDNTASLENQEDQLARQPAVQQTAASEAKLRKLLEDKLSIRVGRGAFQALRREGFSPELAAQINAILVEVLVNGVVTSKDILLKEGEKGIVLRDVGTQEEKIVQNLNRFFGLDQAKTMARILGQPLQKEMDYGLTSLVVDIVQRIIQPNITLNRNETQERKTKAALEVEPVRYKIKAGEMLLREGERVTDIQVLKLQTLASLTEKERVLASGFGATLLIISLILSSYILHLFQPERLTDNRNKHLLLLASVFLAIALLAQLSFHFAELVTENFPYPIPDDAFIFGIPVAAGAMVVCLFPRPSTGAPVCHDSGCGERPDLSQQPAGVHIFPDQRLDGRLLGSKLPRTSGIHLSRHKNWFVEHPSIRCHRHLHRRLVRRRDAVANGTGFLGRNCRRNRSRRNCPGG